jgi:diguanylate cyclase (GGDEF)-like protein
MDKPGKRALPRHGPAFDAPPAGDTDLYALLLDMSGDAALLHDGGRVLAANEAAAVLFQRDSPADLVGRAVEDLFADTAGASAAPQLAAYPKRRSVDTRLRLADGSELDAQLSARACMHQGLPATQLLIRASPRPGVPDADLLTDLPNRRQFRSHLQAAIDRAIRNRHQVWVLYVDLDRFAMVNTRHGHRAGDAVLAEAAVRLQACVRKTDLVASPGGDEFLIALEGSTDLEGARVVATRALESLARPFPVDGAEIATTACIGISAAPGDGATPDVLLQNVDVALWQAKAGSRNRFEFFSAQMDAEHRRSTQVRADTERKLASLTPREREVLEHLVAGEANKMIAYELGASMRTIEHHRARIMGKMQAGSLPELVRMVLGRRDG